MVDISTNKKTTKISEMTLNKKPPKGKAEDSSDAPRCPYCGSTNVYGISRVVGYYSIIDNWNKSKKAELKKRQKGNYWYDERSEK